MAVSVNWTGEPFYIGVPDFWKLLYQAQGLQTEKCYVPLLPRMHQESLVVSIWWYLRHLKRSCGADVGGCAGSSGCN